MASGGGSARRGDRAAQDARATGERQVEEAERARRKRARAFAWQRRLRLLAKLFVVFILLPLLAAGGVAGMFVYYASDPKLPGVRGVSDYRPPQLTRVFDRTGKVIGEVGSERRTLVGYAQFPKVLVDAVIAAEDADFFKHRGFDYAGFARAVLDNLKRGRLGPGRWGQGGSTITQQVVKMMLLSPEKTLRRKVQEIILARRLSDRLKKEEILQIYLNQYYFGHGRYGVEEASRFYFGKSVAEIALGEAAMLAGMLQAPDRTSPHKNPEGAKRRQVYVLDQMARLGFVDRPTAERIAGEPILVVPPTRGRPNVAPEAMATIQRSLLDSLGEAKLSTLGTSVKTTIDARLQETARRALERGLEVLDERQGYRGPSVRPNAAALARHRSMLEATHKQPPKDGEIVEGVVARVEPRSADAPAGGLRVELGAVEGTVDLAAEVRYALGPKPLVERFRPGDIVRVRVAPERKNGEDAGRDKARDKGRGPGAAVEKAAPLALALELGPQGAMVVMDPRSRAVLALVGGYGYRPGTFDRSQQAARQPGSAFKPFVFAAAIDSLRFHAASVVNDAPEVYELWKPHNYDRAAFRGPVRLRTALADSINSVSIKLMHEIGLPAVRDLAARAGISSALPDSLGLSMALGTSTVTPLELANAYATFAAGGMAATPKLLAVVGEDVVAYAEPSQGMRAETAYVLVSLMRSVVEDGTARAVGQKFDRPLAGKTGTSNDYKDAWFVGFSPDLLAAVWVGFDDGKRLGAGEAGARAALPIWIDFMSKALAELPVADFVQPAGVIVTQIDPATGMLAATGAEGLAEVFIEGTAPKDAAPTPGEEVNPDKILLENSSAGAPP